MDCQTVSGADTRITASDVSVAEIEFRVPALTILAHPNVQRVGERVLLPELRGSRGQVALSRTSPHFSGPDLGRSRALDSVHLSRQPLFLEQDAQSEGVRLDRAGSKTPVMIAGEPLGEQRTLTPSELEQGVVLELGRRVVLLLHEDAAVASTGPSLGMVGDSLGMRQLRREIQIAARLDVHVLLRGESGSGKELVAKAIHEAGPRAERSMVTVNMAAIPPSLAASALFGASKGAFTGADRKQEGYFQRAASGTLLMDEIGETPDEIQPLLLRALENGEIQPVGSVETRRVNVRVVAATDADLEAEIESGKFRRPLLHRLAGYEIRLPPLRTRRSDFGSLLVHFLNSELRSLGHGTLDESSEDRPWPPAKLVARLARCSWPGNIRQLKNVARRMAVAHVSGTPLHLDPEALGEDISETSAQGPSVETSGERQPTPETDAPLPAASHGWRPAYRKPSDVDEEELLRALQDQRYDFKATANALGISRASLYNLVKDHPKVKQAGALGLEVITAALEQHGQDLAAAALHLKVSPHALKRRLKDLESEKADGNEGT